GGRWAVWLVSVILIQSPNVVGVLALPSPPLARITSGSTGLVPFLIAASSLLRAKTTPLLSGWPPSGSGAGKIDTLNFFSGAPSGHGLPGLVAGGGAWPVKRSCGKPAPGCGGGGCTLGGGGSGCRSGCKVSWTR